MLNDNIKKFRKIKKLTQEQIAEKLNVSRQTVSKWESGETIPDIYNCCELAKLYEITVDDLLNEQKFSNINPKGKHIFGLVRIDDENKIIIPKKARKIFRLSKGDRLLMLGDEETGIALVKSKNLFDFAHDILNSKEITSGEDDK
ncbi:MAG: helix-turn-helix domain-containing protein [Oscillospiraceae bacterium]|nr:helix-turn-helix domain-containing protein [Oscillospiraceae bacterium]